MNDGTIRFLALAGLGLALTLCGGVWDVALHAQDEQLAAREGVLSLSEPAHLLAALGLLATAVGVVGAALSARREARRALPAWAVILGTALVALAGGAVGASALGGAGDAHDAHAATEAHARMPQYPDVAAATGEQRAVAQSLVDRTVAATAKYRDVSSARADGYRVDPEGRNAKGRLARALHAGNPAHRGDGRTLDPARPEALIYGRRAGKLVLVGALFAVRRGEDAPTPGGPITRWHTHGGPRQMMHVWFTDDLRSAYARRVPVEVAEKYGVEPPPGRLASP